MNVQEDYGGGCGLPKQNRVWRVVLDALPNRCYQGRKKCNKMCFIRIVKDTKISIQKTMLFSNKVTKLALLARAVARVSKKTRSGKIVGLAGTLFYCSLCIFGHKNLDVGMFPEPPDNRIVCIHLPKSTKSADFGGFRRIGGQINV